MNNVYINQRACVHFDSSQQLLTQDVCYTTIHFIPIVYNNIATTTFAKQTARDVFVNNKPLCHKASCFSPSHGDEAGTYKGIHSGTLQGKAEFLTASSNVIIEGHPAVRAGDLMISNNRNSNIAPLS